MNYVSLNPEAIFGAYLGGIPREISLNLSNSDANLGFISETSIVYEDMTLDDLMDKQTFIAIGDVNGFVEFPSENGILASDNLG